MRLVLREVSYKALNRIFYFDKNLNIWGSSLGVDNDYLKCTDRCAAGESVPVLLPSSKSTTKWRRAGVLGGLSYIILTLKKC